MSSPKDDPVWREAIKGVKPLKKAGKVQKDPPKIYRRRVREPEAPAFNYQADIMRRQSPFDPLLFSKIASGKIPLQFSFDLHGLSETGAYEALLDILGQAYMEGLRYGLIVTGKGRLGQSPIRAQVPKWLTSPKLSQIVSSFEFSAQRHGGDGAYYVLLRRHDR
ncbi:MAG TPA: Smr/MutS family protein [Sphingomonadales bacterium]|nr:Smr/MutS family protein [Sphingomonadales bacterium]